MIPVTFYVRSFVALFFALVSITIRGNVISFPLVSGPTLTSGLAGVPEASFAAGEGPSSTTYAPDEVSQPLFQPSILSPTTPTLAFTSSIAASYSAMVMPTSVPGPEVAPPANPDFFGLGDSFAAGIGASCGTITLDDPSNGDCKKCMGGYPYQTRFNTTHTYLQTANFKFYACSGAKTNGIINPPGPGKNSQVQQILDLKNQGLTNFDTIGWSTLSVGGNNVGFARIVSKCLMFAAPDCENEWARTSELISSVELQRNLTTSYSQILDQMTTSPFHLYVTGYAQFYNQETDICNDKRMLPYPDFGTGFLPLLTNELRSRANLAVKALNDAIYQATIFATEQRTDGRSVRFIDIDQIYEGNRFCEDRPNWKSGAWFFTAFGSDIGTTAFDVPPDAIPDPTTTGPLANISLDLSTINTTTCQDEADDSGDWGDQFICTLAQQVVGVDPSQLINMQSDDPDDNSTLSINPPGNIGDKTFPTIPGLNYHKAFHPKTIALSLTADWVYLAWWIRW